MAAASCFVCTRIINYYDSRNVKMRGLARNLIKSCRRANAERRRIDDVCCETLFSLNKFEINFHRKQEIILLLLIACGETRREELALSLR